MVVTCSFQDMLKKEPQHSNRAMYNFKQIRFSFFYKKDQTLLLSYKNYKVSAISICSQSNLEKLSDHESIAKKQNRLGVLRIPTAEGFKPIV